MSELIHAFKEGPGIVAFKNSWENGVLDEATDAFSAIIKDEMEKGVSAGDHFGEPGTNSRMWNSLEKLAVNYP
jgi:ectoine hydroxylase-related dioxygenase (phytanoyl-CoA dioxygenase family)